MTDETSTDEMTQVLRTLWDGEGQSRDEVEKAFGETKTCRNMKHVNFDSMAEPGTDLGAAWREKLRREGKLAENSGSLGDLILGKLAGAPTPGLAPAPRA